MTLGWLHGKRSKVWLLAFLTIVTVSGVTILLTKDKPADHGSVSRVACESWNLVNVLRTPDTIVLQSVENIMEYVKLLVRRGRARGVSAKDIEWLNKAKEDICSVFGISPSPEILICEDGRMLAQAGPRQCHHAGNKKNQSDQRGQRGWILFSTAVLQTLPPEEVVAVLAHELAHVAKGHHMKRAFLILDFYRLMLLWSFKQKDDSTDEVQTIASTAGMWLLLGLRSRGQELEADRLMLDIVNPATALFALARMHRPTDDPSEVLRDTAEVLKKGTFWLHLKMLLTGASHPCLALRVQALDRACLSNNVRLELSKVGALGVM